jgi:hypothetical protein
MKARWELLATMIAALLLATASPTAAGIAVRVGFMVPQGDAKDLAKTGWRGEIAADLGIFRLPFLTTAVSVSVVDFAKKKVNYEYESQSFQQESHIAMTGGGIGLHAEPPALPLKPFAEVLLRLASVEQEYKDGDGGSELDSKTKFGYQVNGGVKFAAGPKISLEVGASYMSFFNNKFRDKRIDREVDFNAFGGFVGLALGLGL